jgi:hypothetical protein
MKITKIEKVNLLLAMRETLLQYVDKTHSCFCSNCPMCLNFRKFDSDANDKCRACPMHVFKNTHKEADHEHHCMNRRCEPQVFSGAFADHTPMGVRAVKKFYRLAIDKVKSMTEEELQAKDAFVFLRDIDTEVADDHKINLDREF